MEQELLCPNCGSSHVTANKKGFSGKKAVGGALLTGGIGLLAGTIGSNKIKITCLSCGHKFSPGQGAKSQDDFALKKEQQRQAGKVALIIIAVIAIIIIINNMFSSNKSADTTNNNNNTNNNVSPVKSDVVAPTAVSPIQRVDYEVLTRDNDGTPTKIIIDPKLRNEKDIKLLGETLKYDTKDDKIVIVGIFDNVKAATLSENEMDLTDAQDAFVAKHMVASYSKNTFSGLHQLIIRLHGDDGKTIDVQY